MDRFDRRQGFLASALIHLLAMSLLLSTSGRDLRLPLPEPAETPEVRSRVFLPPPAALAEVMPRTPPPPAPRPVPTPPPPPAEAGKDRISVGRESDPQAADKVLELRREDDLTQVARGNRTPGEERSPQSETGPARPAATPFEVDGATRPAAGRDAEPLRLPPGGRIPQPANPRSLAQAAQETLERRLSGGGPIGDPGGSLLRIGGLAFDPQGADFTAWANHFKNELYRNWIPPQSYFLGLGSGEVILQFEVDRSGRVHGLRMVKGTGSSALDRAAANAVQGAQLLPLPADYRPDRLAFSLTMTYVGP